jgi:pSer/pThr/pTyr-binding forkhead associated (FHA) protein
MAFLIVEQERREIDRYELTGPVVVGRGRDCDVVIRDAGVSRRHCRLEPTPDGDWRVTDLGSRNGLVIRATPVRDATLVDGDRVWLGKAIRLRFGVGPLTRRQRPKDPIEAFAQLAAAGATVNEPVDGPAPEGWDVSAAAPSDGLSTASTGLMFGEQARRVRPLTPGA